MNHDALIAAITIIFILIVDNDDILKKIDRSLHIVEKYYKNARLDSYDEIKEVSED